MVGVLGLIAWHIAIKASELKASVSSKRGREQLAALYRVPRDAGLEPELAIIVPACNEGQVVARAIHACLGLDYPQQKLEIVVVNDGSTDDTWGQMLRAVACYPQGPVRCARPRLRCDNSTSQGGVHEVAADGVRPALEALRD